MIDPALVLFRFTALLALASALLIGAPAPATAQRPNPDDPYRYDLRVGLFPLSFVAGVSQNSFGTGLRGELDVSRRLVLQLSGRLSWLELGGWTAPATRGKFAGFTTARAGLIVHLFDEVELSELQDTVVVQDAGSPNQRKIGTDSDGDDQLDLPISGRLGSPRMVPLDRREGKAPVRHFHSLRLGYELTRAIERARPPGEHVNTRWELNTFHGPYLGYGFGAQWNLSPATAGEREVGWRRFYFDALLTLEPMVDSEPAGASVAGVDELGGWERPTETSFMPLGLRIGMEGAIGALLRKAPGVGFGYNLELGALPGYSGLEGYLLVNLGLALDFSTRY